MEETVSGQKDKSPPTDYALLRPPIDISICGAIQIYKCLQNGTDELANLLRHECDVIFECKVCQSLFRGLPNFISHKRVYCTKYHQDSLIEFVKPRAEDEIIIVEPKSPEEKLPHSNKKKRESQRSAKSALNKTLDGSFQGSSTPYRFYAKDGEGDGKEKTVKKTMSLETKPIPGTSNAVYQSVQNVNNIDVVNTAQQQVTTLSNSSVKGGSATETVSLTSKSKNSALLEALSRKTGIVKPPVNKEEISNEDKLVKKEVVVPCTSNKNEQHESKSGNNPVPVEVKLAQRTKRFYPCIYCGTTFAQMWRLMRHVIKSHKKSRDEVEKLRDALHKKSFIKVTTSESSFRNKQASSELVSKSVTSTATDLISKTRNQESVSPSSSSTGSRSSLSRSPRLPPAGEDKTDIQFTRHFSLHKCSRCNKVFGRQNTLDRHLQVCNNRRSTKCDYDKSSTVSSVSSHSMRTSKAKRTLHDSDSDEETTKTSSKKKSKVSENTKGRGAKKSETGKQKSSKLGPGYHGYINWKKVDRLIDKDSLVCKKCKAQYSSLHNARRHVSIHMGWNRYKCKLCNFKAFHVCECRHHLSRAHPAAYKRNSDYTELLVDLQKSK